MSIQMYSDLGSCSTTAGNPVMRHNRPPNPSERDAILALIKEDNQFIGILQYQLKLKKKAEENALSAVDDLEIEVAEAEERLKTARELHDFFLQTNSKLSRLKQTPSPPSTPISQAGPLVRSRLSVRSFDSLLQMTTSYNDTTKAALGGSALAMEEATSALMAARDNLQAALTVAQLRKDDVVAMEDQVQLSKAASEKKREMFRSIWKVPEEIWRVIFAEVVNAGKNYPGVAEHGREAPYTALLLSLVCHNWRMISHSTPSLWNDIFIPNTLHPQHIQLIKHYYSLCHRPALSLTISITHSNPTTLRHQYVQHHRSLQRIFNTSTPCKVIKCYVRSATVPYLNTLLPLLPPPAELHISRPITTPSASSTGSGQIEPTPAPIIPPNYCRTITDLHIFSAGAEWADEPSLHLEKYTIIAPPPSAIYGPHRFVPSSSSSIKSISVEGRFVDPNPTRSEDRRVLENVEETKMSLEFLLETFSMHYRLPKLRKLTITKESEVDMAKWEKFLMGLEGEIDEVDCSCMGKGFEALVACLGRLKSLDALTVRGDSVEPILRGLGRPLAPKTFGSKMKGGGAQSERALPALKTLVVDGYEGDGLSIVGYLEKRVADDAQRMEGFKLALRGCPRINADTQARLVKMVTLIH